MEKKVALSIAGSDSSSGAGIQADLKSFSHLGVHGTTVITCVTAQNTQRVTDIFKVPVSVIDHQLEAVFEDFPVAAVKTGMLYDESIVECVGEALTKHHMKPVVDPVMVATSGDTLSHHTFVAALKTHLLPQALMVTANIPEAGILTGIEIHSKKEMHLACKKIATFGPQYILVKGGHLEGPQALDVLYDGKHFYDFSLPFIPEKKAHGSGCSLAALITGLLALGESPVDAVRKAKSIVWAMIHDGYSPGKGSDVLNHFCPGMIPPVTLAPEQFPVWLELRTALHNLLLILPSSFVPEVGMNFVYGLPKAKTRKDICGINGRIVKLRGNPTLCGTLEFGASKHIASVVLAVMSDDSSMRSALNIRYSKELIDACKHLCFSIGTFDRTEEPSSASSTMEWGTKKAIKTLGKTPDIIYDTGGIGKEPMIRLLGKNPKDVLQKLQKLITKSKATR